MVLLVFLDHLLDHVSDNFLRNDILSGFHEIRHGSHFFVPGCVRIVHGCHASHRRDPSFLRFIVADIYANYQSPASTVSLWSFGQQKPRHHIWNDYFEQLASRFVENLFHCVPNSVFAEQGCKPNKLGLGLAIALNGGGEPILALRFVGNENNENVEVPVPDFLHCLLLHPESFQCDLSWFWKEFNRPSSLVTQVVDHSHEHIEPSIALTVLLVNYSPCFEFRISAVQESGNVLPF